MKGNLEKGVLKVLDGGGKTWGAAFLVSAEMAITCAHVVRKAGALPGDRLALEVVGGQETLSAGVDEKAFDDTLDAAVLHLQKPLPTLQPLPLAPSIPYTGKTVRVLGFPPVGKDHTWAEGRILGRITEPNGRTLLQVDSKQLRSGFSGAPLWLDEAGGVVGMQVEGINPQRLDLPEDIAYALPSEMFAILHPALALSHPPLMGELFAVPLLPLNYQPRPALSAELRRLLLGEQAADKHTAMARWVCVHGMGGAGKSVLAQALAREEAIRARFRDGIFWLYIGKKPSKKRLSACQAQVACVFTSSPFASSDLAAGRQELGRLLRDKACLLILDDVWAAAPVKQAFGFDAPASRLLVTTRDAGVLDALEAAEVAVDVLEEGEALQLLCGETRRKLGDLPEAAVKVARQVSYLPFALNLCASLARRGIDWQDILEALTEADLDFIQTDEKTLLSVVHTSVAALPVEIRQRYIELARFRRGEPIPEKAVVDLWRESAGTNRRDAGKLVTLLKDRHLLRRVEGISPNRLLWLHDLQYDYLRWQIKQQTKHRPRKKSDRSFPDDPRIV